MTVNCGQMHSNILSNLHSLHTQNELTIVRSEEHTSELQSRQSLVCRLLLEKKVHPEDGLCSKREDPQRNYILFTLRQSVLLRQNLLPLLHCAQVGAVMGYGRYALTLVPTVY